MSWTITVYPSEHSREVANYDQVRPVASNAPTGLTLQAGQGEKYYIDELGVRHDAPASFEYLPAVAGTRHTLTPQVYIGTYGTRTYKQSIEWSNKLGGAWTWETTINDSADASSYTLSWLVIDGDAAPVTGGLPGTGAGLQITERNWDRWSENDAYANTYAHHNPTQNGVGQALQLDPDGPFAAFSDAHNSIRVYGPPLLHYYAGTDYFEAGGYFPDFGGDGTAATSSLGHSPHGLGESPTAPAMWFARKWYQRVTPKWGSLATSALIHRVDYWCHSPTAWDSRGVGGPSLSAYDSHCGAKPKYFDKCQIIDLADPSGAASAVDVDLLSTQAFAYDGTSAVFIPNWNLTRREILIDDKNGASLGALALGNGSPYRAVAIVSTANNFAIALATKLADVDEDGEGQGDTGHLGSRTLDGRAAWITAGQFVLSSTTGAVNEGFSTRLTGNAKTIGTRPAGWLGRVEYFVIGRIADVVAALNELYSSGALDATPVTPPAVLTANTIFPRGSQMPTPLGTAKIVFITGDSQEAVGDPNFLKYDGNPQLAKFPKSTPLRSDRPIRSTDSRKQIWNSDLKRWEMLQHGRNGAGWGCTANTQFGCETSMLDGLLERDGIDEVFVIKCASAGSAMIAATGEKQGWNASLPGLTTITANVTVTPTSTGATIVGPAGTFSSITAPCGVRISGSLWSKGTYTEANYLAQTGVATPGFLGKTGNNTFPVKPIDVTSRSSDGSTITVNNTSHGGVTFTFASETRSLTFRFGIMSLRTEAAAEVAEALHSLQYDHRLGYELLATVDHVCSNDTGATEEAFRDAVVSHASWMRSLFGADENSATVAPHAIILCSPHMWLGTAEEIEALRRGQVAAAALIPNAVTIETDDLPIRMEPSANQTDPWPPLERTDNGVHFTSLAVLEIGWRINAALNRFSWFGDQTPENQRINPAGTSYFHLLGDIDVALVLEDGTGLSNANAYADATYAGDYFSAIGGNATWEAATLQDKEAALRYATQWIDAVYGSRFVGYRSTSTQALEVPRTLAYDASGYPIDGVPVGLKKATAEAAVRWLTDATQFLPDTAAGSNVTSETKSLGPLTISKSYTGEATTAKGFPVIDRMLRQCGLIDSGNWAGR